MCRDSFVGVTWPICMCGMSRWAHLLPHVSQLCWRLPPRMRCSGPRASSRCCWRMRHDVSRDTHTHTHTHTHAHRQTHPRAQTHNYTMLLVCETRGYLLLLQWGMFMDTLTIIRRLRFQYYWLKSRITRPRLPSFDEPSKWKCRQLVGAHVYEACHTYECGMLRRRTPSQLTSPSFIYYFTPKNEHVHHESLHAHTRVSVQTIDTRTM